MPAGHSRRRLKCDLTAKLTRESREKSAYRHVWRFPLNRSRFVTMSFATRLIKRRSTSGSG